VSDSLKKEDGTGMVPPANAGAPAGAADLSCLLNRHCETGSVRGLVLLLSPASSETHQSCATKSVD